MYFLGCLGDPNLIFSGSSPHNFKIKSNNVFIKSLTKFFLLLSCGCGLTNLPNGKQCSSLVLIKALIDIRMAKRNKNRCKQVIGNLETDSDEYLSIIWILILRIELTTANEDDEVVRWKQTHAHTYIQRDRWRHIPPQNFHNASISINSYLKLFNAQTPHKFPKHSHTHAHLHTYTEMNVKRKLIVEEIKLIAK